MRELKRREFTQQASLAFLAGVVVVIADCGGGGGGGNGDDGYGNHGRQSDGGTPPTALASGDKSGSISANHGHIAVISSAQLRRAARSRSTSRAPRATTTWSTLVAQAVRTSATAARSRRSRH